MAGTIAFTEVDVSDEGEIRCRVHRGDRADELRFRLPHAFAPAPDLVASAFATLCGTGFDRVRIDLPLGPRTRGRLEEALATPLDSGDGTDVDREPGRRHILNFSGGFDSLAARAVLPEADLVSLDFGGRFARERPLFELFRPHIVETNLVDLGLNRNHWSFMGVGAILLRDELDLGTYSFGSVQAGSLPKLFTGPVDQHRTRMAAAPDMRIMNPVSGLCEIGAMMIAVLSEPELPVRVLESVAHPGETKHHRKHLMLRAVAARLGLDLTLPPSTPPRALARWGANFADDLSALYCLSVLGPEAVAGAYDGGIPETVVERITRTDLSFMERFNPHAHAGLPLETRADLHARLIRLGVLPYERTDWLSAATAMKAIRNTL